MVNFKDKLQSVFNEYGLTANNEQLSQFYDYYVLLTEWNKKMNLTSITEPDEVIVKHFLDCCLNLDKFSKGASIIDVGTGAGFPAVPIKIMRPDLKICLVDSLLKRTTFLNELVVKLNLNKVEVIHSRSEDLGLNENYREKFDYCVSRAVASLSTLVEYCSAFVKPKGFIVCYKSKGLDEEIENAKNAFKVLNLKVYKNYNFEIKEINATRNILFVLKTNKTPAKYPRLRNLPKIKPL